MSAITSSFSKELTKSYRNRMNAAAERESKLAAENPATEKTVLPKKHFGETETSVTEAHTSSKYVPGASIGYKSETPRLNTPEPMHSQSTRPSFNPNGIYVAMHPRERVYERRYMPVLKTWHESSSDSETAIHPSSEVFALSTPTSAKSPTLDGISSPSISSIATTPSGSPITSPLRSASRRAAIKITGSPNTYSKLATPIESVPAFSLNSGSNPGTSSTLTLFKITPRIDSASRNLDLEDHSLHFLSPTRRRLVKTHIKQYQMPGSECEGGATNPSSLPKLD